MLTGLSGPAVTMTVGRALGHAAHSTVGRAQGHAAHSTILVLFSHYHSSRYFYRIIALPGDST